jgi:hypothetical protein
MRRSCGIPLGKIEMFLRAAVILEPLLYSAIPACPIHGHPDEIKANAKILGDLGELDSLFHQPNFDLNIIHDHPFKKFWLSLAIFSFRFDTFSKFCYLGLKLKYQFLL